MLFQERSMKESKMVEAYVNSIETFGTLDGPGIRVVIFMQGCILDCAYCHNADMIKKNIGKKYSDDGLLKEVMKYKSYLDISKGGVTLSGGEPLLQQEFVYIFLKKCKEESIHTAIDTCCYADKRVIKKISEVCDLFMISIKQFHKNKNLLNTDYDVNKVLDNILYLSNELKKPIILRHVLVPGYTDKEDELNKLVDFAKKLESLHFIEVLPYHPMGEHKREKLGEKKFGIPSEDEILKCVGFIKKNGVQANFNH